MTAAPRRSLRGCGPLALLGAVFGCNPGTAARPLPSAEAVVDAPPPEAPEDASRVRRGLHLEITGAPAALTVEVQASDDRPPVIKRRPLAADASLPLDAGFYTITLAAGAEERRVQLYADADARIDLRWDDPAAIRVEGGTLLDRAAAELAWSADTEEMTAASRSPGEDQALVQEVMSRQRTALTALPDSPFAELLLLRHAWLSAQVAGPEEAWSVMQRVPADSVAWAATSPWIIELQWFVREHPEATARLQDVRAKVADPGLRAAFIRGELLAAERSGDPDELAARTLAATHIEGPPVVGEAMPRFEMRRPDTREVLRSEALLGAPYVVKVWSTWCAPCIAAMADLHAVHSRAEEGPAPKLQIISVSIDQTLAPVQRFRESQWPMPWTHGWVPGGEPLFKAWSFSGVPYEVLVDAEGTVLAVGAHVSLDPVLR